MFMMTLLQPALPDTIVHTLYEAERSVKILLSLHRNQGRKIE